MTEESKIICLAMDKADADSEQCKQEAAEDWIADDIQVKLEPCHDEHCLDEERLMIDPIVCQQGLDLFCADVPIKCMEEIEIDEVKVQPFYEGDEIMKSIPGENDKLQRAYLQEQQQSQSLHVGASPVQERLKFDCINNINSEIARTITLTGSEALEPLLAPRNTSESVPLDQRSHLAEQNGSIPHVDLNRENVIEPNLMDEAANNRIRRRSLRIRRILERVQKIIHTEEHGTVWCEICNKKLKCKWNLKVHKLMVHGCYFHNCNECGESFSNIALLSNHHRTHYRCVICNKSFTTKYRWAVHNAAQRHLSAKVSRKHLP